MNYCVVRLPGGLGNQLFALFAARYIAQETDLQTYLDFDGIDYSHHPQTIDISHFSLEPQERFLSKDAAFLSQSSNIRTIQRFKVELRKKFPAVSNRINYFLFDPGYDSRESLDRTLEYIKSKRVKFPMSFEGYFADFSYFDRLKIKESKFVQLKVESLQYQRLSKEIHVTPTLGVHLRLGDFLKHPDTIGCLSDDFFIGAVENAFDTKKYNQVWIFTDSPEIAFDRIRHWPFRKITKIVGIDGITNACEELLLLSQCAGIICSNSTFSFWGAKLASNQFPGVQVLFPESFRRDKLTSIQNVPNSWKPIRPIWSD